MRRNFEIVSEFVRKSRHKKAYCSDTCYGSYTNNGCFCAFKDKCFKTFLDAFQRPFFFCDYEMRDYKLWLFYLLLFLS